MGTAFEPSHFFWMQMVQHSNRGVVLGNGRSGRAAADVLRREGWTVDVLDGADVWPDRQYDLCVTSPGIPLDHPWQQQARERHVPVISELQLAAERWHAAGGRMLAVTGSKGKSSVVKLVADALSRAGRPALPCGNYGTPLCELVLSHLEPHNVISRSPLPWAVVEVSSFQMETTELPEDAFEAAAVLNLQEDHLDRHGCIEVYHALKRRLLGMARVRVDGTDLDARANSCQDLMAGSYFDNPVLRVNGLCAVALLRVAGLDDSAIADAFATFEPLPHRMQTVLIRDGVRWIDDSKATSLAALAAGVEMALARPRGTEPGGDFPVLLIAGGLPKGDDPFSVIPRLRSGVKKVYLIGRCAKQLFAAWRETVTCEVCETLDRAVESARRDACPGETVLLSPGTASFDQFKSYGARGDRFASLAWEGADAVDGCTSKRG